MMQWSKNLEAVTAIKPKSCTKTQQQANKWKTYQTCADRIFFDLREFAFAGNTEHNQH